MWKTFKKMIFCVSFFFMFKWSAKYERKLCVFLHIMDIQETLSGILKTKQKKTKKKPCPLIHGNEQTYSASDLLNSVYLLFDFSLSMAYDKMLNK